MARFIDRCALAGGMTFSQEQADRVRGVLGNHRDLAEKEMFGGIAFLFHGNMAVGVHGEDLIVRVEPSQTDALLREPGAKPFTLSGRKGMAGWILVAPSGYRNEAQLRQWVAKGVSYAQSLPKKTPRKGKR